MVARAIRSGKHEQARTPLAMEVLNYLCDFGTGSVEPLDGSIGEKYLRAQKGSLRLRM